MNLLFLFETKLWKTDLMEIRRENKPVEGTVVEIPLFLQGFKDIRRRWLFLLYFFLNPWSHFRFAFLENLPKKLGDVPNRKKWTRKKEGTEPAM